MYGKVFNIKVNTNSTSNEQQFNDFQEWFDYEHQRIEQECLIQQEQKEQQSFNKPLVKKIKDEDVSYTDDLRHVFPKHYNKSFKLVKKSNSKDFVFFKYSSNNGKIDENEKEDLECEEESSSSSEELESKDLLLKELNYCFKMDNSIQILKRCFQNSMKIINQKLVSSIPKF
jgi:hypothetical protein